MSLETFLTEYTGTLLGAFGIGFGISLLITHFKKMMEKI